MGNKGAKKIVSTADLELQYLTDLDSAFAAWRRLAGIWLSSQKNVTGKSNALRMFFVQYIYGLRLSMEPRSLLLVSFAAPSLWKALRLDTWAAEVVAISCHDHIVDFLDWVLKEGLAEIGVCDSQVVDTQLHNPFPRLRTKYYGKISDVELRHLLHHDPQMEDWRALAAEWLAKQRVGVDTKLHALNKFLITYILKRNLDRNPYRFLSRATKTPSFIDVHLAAKRGASASNGGKRAKLTRSDGMVIRSVSDFLDWILTEKLSVEDDNGHRVIPVEFHNPVPRVSYSEPSQTETFKTPLPYRYIKQLRGLLAEGPTFRDWVWAQQAIDNGGDWFIVDSSLINIDDPDCVWRRRRATKDERKHYGLPTEVVELWSPVRAMAIYIKLELPLRTFQVRMLDSGEADTWRYASGKWCRNNSSLAIGSEKRPSQRGVFHRGANDSGTGFYINTNKTADISKDELGKGYVIPWTHEPALYWLEKLRNWQERYNPIKAPTPWGTLETKHFGRTPPHASVLEERGTSCFLFRHACRADGDREKPIHGGALDILWYRLLARLESQCTTDAASPVHFVDPDSRTNTYYPLHALRVSLITAFALEGGVPFPVLSKLIAGHARLIMTLYYTKAGKAHVTEVMQEAERRMLHEDAASHRRFLMERTYEEIEQRYAFVNPDALKAVAQQKSSTGFIVEDKGICPVGAGLCDVGGERISERLAESLNAPVPGYPQVRNCIRCRFFLTGPAFLPGLQAHFNEISYKVSECSERYVNLEFQVRGLEDDRAKCEEVDAIFTQQTDLERLYQQYEAEAEKANNLLIDMQSCARLISRSIEIANADDIDSVRLVASGGISDIQYALTETTSEFHQLEVLCENAVIYPEIDAGKAALRRGQVLDAMLQMNGKPPIFFRLTPEQQLKVGNEVMKLIQVRAGSLRNAVEFAEGYRLLDELGLLDDAVNLIEEKTGGVAFRQVIEATRAGKLLTNDS